MNKFFIRKIAAKNFRNLLNPSLEFSKEISCIYGNNAQGKTNVLEMIYYVFNLKSFKKKCSFSQILAVDGDKPEFYISALYESTEKNILTTKTSELLTEVYLNNKKIKKDLNSERVFILVPIDAYNFFNERIERLQWIDGEVARSEKLHSKLLGKYSSALRQRNILLSSKNSDPLQIKTLTLTMSELAVPIINNRQRYLASVLPIIVEIFYELFSQKDKLEIVYKNSLKINTQSPEKYAQNWLKLLDEELFKKTTKAGPHLDDLTIMLNGFPINTHGSMGQQKMAYFSLFFASIRAHRSQYETLTNPLVLLDDISSEIDSLRWKSLIKYLLDQQYQVILTTANKIFRDTLETNKAADIFLVNQGLVQKCP